MKRIHPILGLALVALLMLPVGARAAGHVEPLFDVDALRQSPFPSDRFTVADDTQLTGLRVELPKPDCGARPSDCADIDTINTLDGFNLQPRLSIPFSGPIDPASLDSTTVFVLALGGADAGTTVDLNQIVWDPATYTLHAEADELLDQHTRYALIVTRGVLDESGNPIHTSEAFEDFRHDLNLGQAKDPRLKAYRKALLDAVAAARAAGVPREELAVVSVFTTQSITSTLENIRDQVKAGTPQPADFRLGPGESRTVFPVSSVANITLRGLLRTRPVVTFSNQSLLGAVNFLKQTFPGAVGQIAFGKYSSPDYLSPCPATPPCDRFIPPVGTRAGTPQAQGTNDVFFNLFLPSGSPPSGGWPVVIFGSGSPDNKNVSPFRVASAMAAHGLAVIAINAVGLGLGPGTLAVTLADGQVVTLPSGGRSADENDDGVIGTGVFPTAEGGETLPQQRFISRRDALRQTVVDLMQLVRVIEVGVDADGDGTRELDPSRIYYFGWSHGANIGTMLSAIEPGVRAAALTAVGGNVEAFRLSPMNRPAVGGYLDRRMPPLVNPPGLSSLDGVPVGLPRFDENVPLRNRPPVVNTVVGALDIQRVIDHTQWVLQTGDPTAYAPYLRNAPLGGVPEKAVIVPFARGDQTIPNPATTALLRAGSLADRATLFRNDLAFGTVPTMTKNPHDFAIRVNPPQTVEQLAIARAVQLQIGRFFASDGATVIDPDEFRGGCLCLFDTPIGFPLPEDLAFIP